MTDNTGPNAPTKSKMLVPIPRKQINIIDRARGDYSRSEYIQLLFRSVETNSANFDQSTIESIRETSGDILEIDPGSGLLDHELVPLPEKLVQRIDDLRDSHSRAVFIGITLKKTLRPDSSMQEQKQRQSENRSRDEPQMDDKIPENSDKPPEGNSEDLGISKKPTQASDSNSQEQTETDKHNSGIKDPIREQSNNSSHELEERTNSVESDHTQQAKSFVILWSLAMATFLIIRWMLDSEPSVQINL